MRELKRQPGARIGIATILVLTFSVVAVPSASTAPPGGGIILYKGTGNVTITLVSGATTPFVNGLSWRLGTTLDTPRGLWDCQGAPSAFELNSSAGLLPGAELIFSITYKDGPAIRTFFTGPGVLRNADRLDHAKVVALSGNLARVSFEDTLGGGDNDFDDCVFDVTGNIAVASAPSGPVPDTSCASAVGMGPGDAPHVYYASSVVTFANDACPDHYSGEFGLGVGGVWLFSREGPSADGGEGVGACYGSVDPTAGPTTPHHGAGATVKVEDAVLGGAVAFSVTRDYNRSADNPFLPVGNDLGDFDCGDQLVEPCPEDDPTAYTTAPGCNPLDASEFVFPARGLCAGLSSLGPLTPADPGLIALAVNFALSLLGLADGSATCSIPPANSWTAPGTLAEWAGADGAIVVFLGNNARADAGHAGAATTGRVWTE